MFPTFFRINLVQDKVFYDILERKNALQAVQKRSSKSRKIDIFPNFVLHFLVISARKISFTTFQTEKKPLQAIKTRSSKSRKNDIFPKGVAHGFGPEMAIFPNFVLHFLVISARKMSFTTFQTEKKPFQALKTRRSKSRKIDIFPKGLAHGFGPEMAIFPIFFIRQYRPGKCLFRYFRTNKRLSRL